MQRHEGGQEANLSQKIGLLAALMALHESSHLSDARGKERLVFRELLLRGKVRRQQPLRVAGPVFAPRRCFPFQFCRFSAVMKRSLLSSPVLVRHWLIWDSAASILRRLGW